MAPPSASAQLRNGDRQDFTIVDVLIGFGHRENWQRPLVETANPANQYADRLIIDWRAYCGYDRGTLHV
ncbi:MAG TPA: hypothetical protein VHN11_10110 [Xanthobacteraceae bacterium]|jgi:hypothetical protein|nr:hypothetical protein [Xanthobacteraceae bacterium]